MRSMSKSQCGCVTLMLTAALLLSAGLPLFAQPNKLAISPMGNSITGSFDGKASYRYYLWRSLVDSGFAVKGEEKVDFTGFYCGVDDANIQDDCGDPLYDSTEWDWDHDGLHATETYYLWRIAYMGSWTANDLGYPGIHIVLLHHGTNDALHVDASHYSKGNVAKAIDTLRNWNPNVVILLSQIIPALSPYGAPVEDTLLAFNQRMAELAVEKSLPESPIILVDHYSGYDPLTMNGTDGIHPLDTGERWIAEHFRDSLMPVLRQLADPPTVELATPASGVLPNFRRTTLTAVVSTDVVDIYPDRGVQTIEFLVNGVPKGPATKVNDTTYTYDWMPPDSGEYTISARITDYCHRTIASPDVDVFVAVNGTPLGFTIPAIQSSGFQSPYNLHLTRTPGRVTRFSADSSVFWMEDRGRNDPLVISDGIKVVAETYEDGRERPGVGDSVVVVGTIREVSGSPVEEPATTISAVDSIRVVCPVGCFAPSVTIAKIAIDSIELAKKTLERFEGMMADVSPDAIVVGPTDDSDRFTVLTLPSKWGNQAYVGDGVLKVVPGAGGAVDYNPERLVIDCGLVDGGAPDVAIADTLKSATGIVDYEDGTYILRAAELSVGTAETPTSPVSNRFHDGFTPTLTYTTYHLDGVFDTLDAAGKADEVWTPAQYAVRMAKLTKAVVDELRSPTILALQGVENTTILQDLADRVNQLGGAAYKALSLETSHPAGLECGFLYDSTTMSVDDSYLLSGAAVESAFGATSGNPCAEPLYVRFDKDPNPWWYLNVVNIDLVDRSADDPIMGANVPHVRHSESQRAQQAAAVRAFVDGMVDETRPKRAQVLVLGNMNDLPFAEQGESESALDILLGDPGAGQVLFEDLTARIHLEKDRYSVIRNGNAELTACMVASPAVLRWVNQVDALHFNARFPVSLGADSANALRSSSQDAIESRW